MFSVTTMQWQGQNVQANEAQWVVKLNGLSGAPGEQVAAANASLNAQGLSAIRQLGADGLFLVHAPKTQELGTVQKALKSVNGFSFVEPDLIFTASAVPNDPYFANDWGLNNTGQTGGTVDADIDAPEAWDIANGSSATPVVTAVVDSGVDYNHPDLAANMWKNPGEVNGKPGVDDDGDGYVDDVYGYDFANNDSDPFDDNGHGTHVSGTISGVANNGIGVAGVNYNGKIMALKFLGANGSGSLSAAVSAINYAVKMKTQYGVNVRVLNNSWGGGGFTQSLYDAIAASGNAGQIFIAAAGNGGSDQIGDNNDSVANYPSNYDLPNVVAVAATDNKDALASFSNYGATTVDLGAPGVSIVSTYPNNQYATMSGTSMATPHVSGAASLAFSYAPNASVADVKNALMNGGDNVASLAGKTVSGKRLNLVGMLNALTATPAPSPAPAPSPTSGNGLAATYFDNKDFTGKSLSRTDTSVNFNWGTGAPASGLGSDTFSARWTGYVVPTQSQTYTFYTNADDGARLWVNGNLVIDKWGSKGEFGGSISLVAGQAYSIKMEYFENTGKAYAKLSWATPTLAKQIIPQSQLYTSDPTATVAVSQPVNVFSGAAIGTVENQLLTDSTAVL